MNGKLLNDAINNLINNPAAAKVLTGVHLDMGNLSAEQMAHVATALGITPPAPIDTIKAAMANMTPEQAQALKESLSLILSELPKTKKDKALALAMSDPEFKNALANEQGLVASLGAAVAGNEMVAAVGDISKLTNDPEQLAGVLANPKAALEVFGNLLNQMSTNDLQVFNNNIKQSLTDAEANGLSSKQE